MLKDECARCGCEMKLDKGQKPLCPDCLKVPNAGANVPYLGPTPRHAPSGVREEQTMTKPGTKVLIMTAAEPETGCVLKPRKVHLPLPSPDWCIVRFDSGGVMCVHQSRLKVQP
jgi:hypothetical protein